MKVLKNVTKRYVLIVLAGVFFSTSVLAQTGGNNVKSAPSSLIKTPSLIQSKGDTMLSKEAEQRVTEQLEKSQNKVIDRLSDQANQYAIKLLLPYVNTL